ncbi:MAG TPA: alkaline phosphatase family protein [Candidatus Binataceae bacterium]|nr:alkaline phosphatase family protein [Candidatus Binataceae bacterium]
MKRRPWRWLTCAALAATLATAIPASVGAQDAEPQLKHHQKSTGGTTPIQHLVVIFQENISFDHYFGTYPNATNPPDETPFVGSPDTPPVNGLTGLLLTNNPNLNDANGTGATNPFRLDPSQAATSDQDHDYTPEQMAFDNGLMDLFPANVGAAGTPPSPPPPIVETTGLTLGYYDGNTVTAYWNYAQHFAMSDNSFGSTFGPSTVGAINLISGQTNDVTTDNNPGGATIADGNGGLTDISDADPVGDSCSTTTGETMQFGGQNIGNLLNAADITWGWFEGGFNLSLTNTNGTTGCSRSTTSSITKDKKDDYIPHHEPFQYYSSTANPTHIRPASVSAIGTSADTGDTKANHQYDSDDFFTALAAGNFPAVVFLKAPGFQDGHAGYSDPLDEQTWVVDTINTIEQSQEWDSTAIVIAYDDSDGWYDHQMSPIVNQSKTSADALTGTGECGNGANALPGPASGTTPVQGRCGFGPRLPMLVISPYSKVNYVDHSLTNQASIIRFIEDNWLSGKRLGGGSFDASSNSITGMLDFNAKKLNPPLYLDNSTGVVLKKPPKT